MGAKVERKNENICMARVNGINKAKRMNPALVSVKNPNPKISPASKVAIDPTTE